MIVNRNRSVKLGMPDATIVIQDGGDSEAGERGWREHPVDSNAVFL